MRKIKIGDTVTATLFGGQKVTGKIENIELCARGSKTGRKVNQCDLDYHHHGVLDLDCGHWCYFDQVVRL